MLVKRSVVALGVGFVIISSACGSGQSVGAGDASAEASGDASAGACCPPDPQPGCCMHYGGWSADGIDSGACAALCDGMPVPSDPSWKQVKDSHGCEVWTSSSGGQICGAPIPDASSD